MTEQAQIKSKVTSISEITEQNRFFSIPIYQRPYVWGEAQVRTLMEDLVSAYQVNGEEDFYLGIVIVVKLAGSDRYDLVDGQQRFTTLCLLARELATHNTALSTFLKAEDKPRIHFPIREHFNEFFTDNDTGHEELGPIRDAAGWIAKSLDELSDKKGFAEFVCNRVRFVLSELPNQLDLNKVFEQLNNRGVQLQQHEVLKAKMLAGIEDEAERAKYAALWDACADMDNYLERSIRAPLGMNAKKDAENKDSLDDPGKVLKLLDLISNEQSGVPQTLEQILNGSADKNDQTEARRNADKDEEEQEFQHVRSIVDFSLFLLHVLRVYLLKHEFAEPKNEKLDVRRHVDARKLIQLFDANFPKGEERRFDPEHAKEFIKLLWRLRWQFDLHIVKWVEKDNQAPELMVGSRSDSSRTDSDETVEPVEPFAMLQMMLYHSQELTTQHWLTPLLNEMVECNDAETLFSYLQKVDNQVVWARHMDAGRKNESLAKLMWDFCKSSPSAGTEPNWSILDQKLGTSFPHYWFYKLEFILWLIFREKKKDETASYNMNWPMEPQPQLNREKVKRFRIRSRSSIEHVSARTEQTDANREDHVSQEYKDDFGNLALVSRESNSAWSNKNFKEKRVTFLENNSYESLKLACIYEGFKHWGDENLEKHRESMKACFRAYWERTCGSQQS